MTGRYRWPTTTIFGLVNGKSENFTGSPLFSALPYFLPFASWDSERFLAIALARGYRSEQWLAFFPGLPLFLRGIRAALKLAGPGPDLPLLLIVGVIINNIVCMVNSLLLIFVVANFLAARGIGEKSAARAARFSAVAYNFSPGFVFSTALYTEPVFFLATNILFLIYGKMLGQGGVMYEAAYAALAVTAALFRSNGALFIVPLILYLIFAARRKYFRRQAAHRGIFLFLRVLLFSAAIMAPSVIFQRYGARLFCGPTGAALPYCGKTFPPIYPHVQRRYWGVRFFYSFRGAENFSHLLYSLPYYFVFLNYFSSLIALPDWGKARAEFFLAAPLGIFFAALLLFSHAQIIFRQAATAPMFWLNVSLWAHGAPLATGGPTGAGTDGKRPRGALWGRRVAAAYAALLTLWGAALFSNFVGWT